MAEELNKSNGNGELKKEKKDIVLTITLNTKNQILVSGPGSMQMYDEPMCLYLLEKAKDTIKATNLRASQPKIATPQQGGIMNFARKRFGR